MWQTRWEVSIKGRVTFTFFNNIQERLQAKWIQPNYADSNWAWQLPCETLTTRDY